MHPATDASKAGNGSSSSSSSSSMSSAPLSSSSSQPALDGNVEDGHVCPFCGLMRDITEDFDATSPCPRCTLADTPTTRNATKARIGPWHVRQMRNPWAPGMRWETLLALIKRGQVTKDSVVRGPTTHQLWRRASEIKGLSREFGLCYSCGGDIDAQANLCAHCNRLQEPPANPNVLVETRDFGTPSASSSQNGSGATGAATQPSQQQSPQGGRAATPAPTRSNGNGPRRRNGAADEPPHLDVGATTPIANDFDDMLTVDDPESAAEVGRSSSPSSSSSRGPARSDRTKSPKSAPPAAAAPSQRGQAAPPPPPPPPPPQEPTASRPVPLRPRQPGADDALLTPQELAAAFRLDFAPQDGGPAAGGAGGRAAANAGGAMPRTQRPPRRKRSKLFGAFVLLLLAGGGTAALMYLRPDVREEAVEWSETNYASVKEFIASRTASAPAPTVTPRPAVPANDRDALPNTRPAGGAGGSPVLAQSQTPTPPAAPVAPPPAPAAPTRPAVRPPDPVVIAPQPAKSGGPKTVVVADDQPAPSPALSRETTKELEPTDGAASQPNADEASMTASAKTISPTPQPMQPTPPVEIIKIAPPATPATASAAPVAKAPAPAPPAAKSAQQQPAKVWTNLSEAEDEARRLWRLAFDAEQNQDFVEAVSLYEQIKKLPPGVHPAGLEVRMSLAKKLMK